MRFKSYLKEDTIQDFLKFEKEKEVVKPEWDKITSKLKREVYDESKALQQMLLTDRNLMLDSEWEETVGSLYYDMPSQLNHMAKGLRALTTARDKVKKHKFTQPSSRVALEGTFRKMQDFFNKWGDVASKVKEWKSKVITTTELRKRKKEFENASLDKQKSKSQALVKLLEKQRKDYIKKNKEEAEKYIDQMLKKLDAKGWDLNKFPSRSNDHQFLRQITKSVNATGRFRGPNHVKKDEARIKRYMDFAIKTAEVQYDKFINKMIEKVGAPVVKADMKGQIWINALLTVETDTGEEQRWKTKVIVNFSKYGKPFNQFPTRKMK